ncbi:hypothetical protein ABVK49_15380 [Mesorhizobium sp. WSM2239]|uniref:HTH merR-type domain-containing protein n=2 Tax=unclassified Mesorhizobium TaxID=325217 RepID=A0AAU8D201_9HYPH
MVDIDEPRFRISEVASATGVAANTIRSWFQRQHLRLVETDKRAEANGVAHKLSLRSALRIGTMGALVAQGVEPSVAGWAATRWTDSGNDERLPGCLFAEPLTVLCVFADGDARVVHSPIGSGRAFDLFVSHGGRQNGVRAILVDFVDKQVRLGLKV